MFTRYQDDKTREWSKVIERYISLHKYIKEVGKISISQARSGHVDNDVQSKLADSLRQTDKALDHLKEFFKPCLTTVDVTDIFTQEKFKANGEGLTQEVSKLKYDNEHLQRQLSDQYRVYGGDTGLQIKDLQNELSLRQQLFDRKQESFLQEKRHLEGKVTELTREVQKLQSNQSLLSLDEAQIQELGKNGSLQIAHIKRHQELEETLKTQNDLIYDLKKQLSAAVRDREILRSLNVTLEMQLQKKTREEYPQRRIGKETPELQNEKDLMEDYFNRSTLKIGEYNSQMETLKDIPNFGQYMQLENGYGKDRPTYKSLEEIPSYYGQDRAFLKSKSYDFNTEYGVDENDNKSQQKQQELGKENDIQYPTAQLSKINEDEKLMANQDDKVNENSTN